MTLPSYGQYNDIDADDARGGEDEQEHQEVIVRKTEKGNIEKFKFLTQSYTFLASVDEVWVFLHHCCGLPLLTGGC